MSFLDRTVEREVEYAIGFTDGTWRRVTVRVPEKYSNVLDDDEVKEKADKIAEKLGFEGQAVAFRTVLYIEPPEGGYDDDRW